jgi:hypothetical protein
MKHTAVEMYRMRTALAETYGEIGRMCPMPTECQNLRDLAKVLHEAWISRADLPGYVYVQAVGGAFLLVNGECRGYTPSIPKGERVQFSEEEIRALITGIKGARIKAGRQSKKAQRPKVVIVNVTIAKEAVLAIEDQEAVVAPSVSKVAERIECSEGTVRIIASGVEICIDPDGRISVG